MAKEFHEALDPRIPESFVAAKPIVGVLERPGVDAHVVNAPADGALHKSGALEGLDVLRRRGERHLVRCRELADGLLAFGEPLEHGASSVVAEGAEHEVEAGRMFNHEVEYTRLNQLSTTWLNVRLRLDWIRCHS